MTLGTATNVASDMHESSEAANADAQRLLDELHRRLGLTLANQDMRQVKRHSEDVSSAVLANASTRVEFCVGDQDARVLADGFSFFKAADL